jgi:hypothetical protein
MIFMYRKKALSALIGNNIIWSLSLSALLAANWTVSKYKTSKKCTQILLLQSG